MTNSQVVRISGVAHMAEASSVTIATPTNQIVVSLIRSGVQSLTREPITRRRATHEPSEPIASRITGLTGCR